MVKIVKGVVKQLKYSFSAQGTNSLYMYKCIIHFNVISIIPVTWFKFGTF